MARYIVPGLVGEVFRTEGRRLTRIYNSILGQIGSGVMDYKVIAQTLYSRKIINTNSSANVLPYMKNMEEMGLLRKRSIYKSNKDVFEINSFPIRLYYYLESRYEISERDFSNREVKPTVEKLLHFGIEDLIGDLFDGLQGGGEKRY